MGKPFNKKDKRAPREAKEFDEEVIQLDRVTRVVKGGRRMRFRATVVIGNHNGKMGYGIGKAAEVQAAIQKAVSKAKKNLMIVPIYNGTIPHDVRVKFKAAEVLIMPAGEGTGIIAGGPVRKIMDLAGVKNVLSKSLGARNRLNVTKCTYEALKKLRVRPDLEAKQARKEAAESEDRAAPSVKTMSKSEAEAQVHADKKLQKAPAKKPASKKSSK